MAQPWTRPLQPSEQAPGEEIASHVNPEPHGATYDMVMSQKTGEIVDQQDPHWTGTLLPAAIPRPEGRAHEFFTGASVLDSD